MPRWLSEGISVYEEKQANPVWGQSMNARYRRMILDGELVPVSRLSGAFLNPPSPLHLQFAYYESSLVIEYLVETFGLQVVTGILADLSTGRSIDTALKRHVGCLDALDEAFAAYAMKRAQELAPGADWESPELSPDGALGELQEWCRLHPRNIEGLTLLAMRLLEARRWGEAKQPLEALLKLYPENTGTANPYLMLATVHRELGEAEAERAVLERLAARSADASGAYLRLVELCEAAGDWEGGARNAERVLAVNPLLRAPYRSLARAAEALGDPDRAIRANRALLGLDPRDPAGTHFRLASLLKETGDLEAAHRHVLMALEEAPRFRAGHRMLLEIVGRLSARSDPEPEEAP
jgi:tetratricopeptide (TPR) repeat protein